MSWRRQVAKFGALFHRRKPADDLAEEIRSHLEMEEEENLESGMPPDEAHYAALRRFGNVILVQERSREMWGWNSVETLWQDLRFGLRHADEKSRLHGRCGADAGARYRGQHRSLYRLQGVFRPDLSMLGIPAKWSTSR